MLPDLLTQAGGSPGTPSARDKSQSEEVIFVAIPLHFACGSRHHSLVTVHFLRAFSEFSVISFALGPHTIPENQQLARLFVFQLSLRPFRRA